MFATSQDVLYIVIAFCVLWTTVFLSWVFYQLGLVLKNTNEIIEEFRVRLTALADAVDYIRHKVEQMSNVMTLATSGVGGLVKKMVTNKAKEWATAGEEKFEYAAKEAVNKAVMKTAKQMHRTAKKVRA